MFKRCFACLLPGAREAEATESIECGFYAGKVTDVGHKILVLELDKQNKEEGKVTYIVPRNEKRGVKAGDVVYLLKEPDRELLTIPSLLPFDECLCTISCLAASHVVLLDGSTEPLVVPCANACTSPMRLRNRHALLVRSGNSEDFDVVFEEEKIGREQCQKFDHSDSTVMMTDDSVPSRNPSHLLPLTFNEYLRETAVAETSEKHNFSFNSPVQDEYLHTSSVATPEGDSGEFPDIKPLGLPDVGSLHSEENSFRRAIASTVRVRLSPYNEAHVGSPVAQPDRIGRNRLPLQLLKQPLISDRQIEAVAEKAAAWRCAALSGSSFFWCVAVAWTEHLARTTTKVGEVDEVIEKVMKATTTSFEIRPGFEQFSETVFKLLQDLRSWKSANRSTAIVRLQPLFQHRDTLLSLELFLRMICANYIEKLAITPELSHILTENLSQSVDLVRGTGMDFSGMAYMAVADSLNLTVSLVKVEEDGTVSVEEFKAEDAGESCGEVMLLQQNTHFHLLYTAEDLAADGYDLTTHCFEVLQDTSVNSD